MKKGTRKINIDDLYVSSDFVEGFEAGLRAHEGPDGMIAESRDPIDVNKDTWLYVTRGFVEVVHKGEDTVRIPKRLLTNERSLT